MYVSSSHGKVGASDDRDRARTFLPERLLVVGPLLQRNRRRIELALVVDQQALALLADDLARRAPREVVHLPEGHERKDEGEERDREDVKQHPSDVFKLAVEDVDDDLAAVDGRNHDEGERRNRLVLSDHHVNELSSHPCQHFGRSKANSSRNARR